MKYFDWNKKKNQKLKKEQGVVFEEVVIAIYENKVLDIINNPSKNFPSQKAYVVRINEYIHYIPFVETERKIFLKTIIPSRKINKEYK